MAGKWSEQDYRQQLWHTASHVLAEAVTSLFPDAKPTIGPPIEEGFYYDFDVKKPFTPDDLKKIEQKMSEIIKRNDKIVGKEISKEEALQLFKGNQFKQELINEFAGEGKKLTVFSQGKFLDLCKGGHVESTGKIKAVKLVKTSGAYWRGSEKNPMLQRIYGIAFPEKSMLEEWVKRVEEAEKRNHLRLGKELDLFSMQEEAPGTVFFHPKGKIVWNELEGFLRKEQFKRGYVEVTTPIIMKEELWKKSGHWDHYKENMYFTEIDEEGYAIKPMNCPGHILIYKNSRHSYRELPQRITEFGIVHRHELSGVLNGLFRVRKFTQDDAHIFCSLKQIEEEIGKVIELIDFVYGKCGFSYHIELSTKPENAMGSDEAWKKATAALENTLKKRKAKFKVNEGDGAFYGPKIDFHIKDSLGRTWQCATIQVDFLMPEKFELFFINEKDEREMPIMLHRVVYGSMERFIGILIEHFAGAFPLWLSPEQVRILAVGENFNKYAEEVHRKLVESGIRSKLDLSNETVSYKVRNAQMQKVNYIVIVGEKEKNNKTIAVRERNGKVRFNEKIDGFVEKLRKEIDEKK